MQGFYQTGLEFIAVEVVQRNPPTLIDPRCSLKASIFFLLSLSPRRESQEKHKTVDLSADKLDDAYCSMAAARETVV